MLSEDELYRIAATARDVVLLTHHPVSCIFSTRVTMGTLRHFGVRSEPWPCEAILLNAAGVEYVEQHRTLPSVEEQEERGIYSFGLGLGDTAQTGHLVVRIPEWGILDPSLDQADRPEHGIPTARAKVFPYERGIDTGEGAWTWRWLEAGARPTITYRPRPDRRRWSGSPDWNAAKRHRPSIAETIRRLG